MKTSAKNGRIAIRVIRCAWCEKIIDRVPDYEAESDYESHGICKNCDEIHFGHIKAMDER